MLNIFGAGSSYCDGLTRRRFMNLGGLALGGASMADVLRAEAASGSSRPDKAVIMVLLPGGPPHMDMYDMKPDAPAEIRGEFRPIKTNVPGIEICELLPNMARIADKLAFVRSLVGGRNDHNLHQCLTGWETHPQQGDSVEVPGFAPGGWPSLGSVIAKLKGPVDAAVPPFISLAPDKVESTTRASLNQSGFLGSAYEGFEPRRAREANYVLKGISADRLVGRRRLVESFDTLRRNLEASGASAGLDAYTYQAFEMLSSGKVAKALDYTREPLSVQDRYGIPRDDPPVKFGPKLLQEFLTARRLVEAGVRCVTLAFSPWPLNRESRGGFNWDFHTDNFRKSRMAMPMFDRGLSALVSDLDDRGMLDDVSIVVWGEFGRTPKINGQAGRDHWPSVGSAVLAGGGMRTGQYIGSTDRIAAYAVDRPVHYRDVFATLYHNLGIDIHNTILHDQIGRPQFLVDDRAPIHELL